MKGQRGVIKLAMGRTEGKNKGGWVKFYNSTMADL
jgi:hypothetical protein